MTPNAQLSLEGWLAILYRELHSRADRHLCRERQSVSISPTELVHEAYLRIVDGAPNGVRDRAHLLALASTGMRRVLVDRARRRRAQKRGGNWQQVDLDASLIGSNGSADMLEIDDLLNALAEIDERGARIVELKVFGGMTDAEIGQQLGISDRWARKLWCHTRAWLRRELSFSASA